MEMYQEELNQALEKIEASGRNPDDFAFTMNYLEPDPDGGGMFTVYYQIDIRDTKTGKAMTTVGGIGNDWLGDFDEALASGHFD